jgi:hypothetical protein
MQSPLEREADELQALDGKRREGGREEWKVGTEVGGGQSGWMMVVKSNVV